MIWIECNARWGGVSVPMTFLNTLFEGRDLPKFVIYHASGGPRPRLAFSDAIEKLGHLLWAPDRSAGVIFLTPSGFEAGKNLHFVALDTTIEDDRRLVNLTIERLWDGI